MISVSGLNSFSPLRARLWERHQLARQSVLVALVFALRVPGFVFADAHHDALLKQDHDHAVRLEAYLSKKFPDQVIVISVTPDRILIKGRLGTDSSGVELAEVPMWDDVTALKSPATLLPIQADGAGSFAAEVDRSDGKVRDRLLSAWAIVRKSGDQYEPLSPLHYADMVKAREIFPRHTPAPSRASEVVRSRRPISSCSESPR